MKFSHHLMRRTVAFGAGLLALAMPLVAAAATYYISPSGSSSNSGLSPSTPWSLSKAMSSLTAGDVCRVLPGSYTGSISPAQHGTANARITIVGDIANPAAATFSGGIETDRSYLSIKGIKVTTALALNASSTTNTARYDSILYCHMRGAHFAGSKHNVVYRNVIVNNASGATIAFVLNGWQDWPGTGFNSNAEYNTFRENTVDCGVITWKAFLMRLFAQRNLIEANRFTARFSGTNGDVQGRYLYNSYYNVFRDNRWVFEADNALPGSLWNCFSLRDSSSYNVFERDTVLCGLQSGFQMYGRLQNAGVSEWNGQTIYNTYRNCVYRMTGYAYLQIIGRGLVIEGCEFSSANGPALVINNGAKYITLNRNTFFSATGRAVEIGPLETGGPPDSMRITNNIFYSKVANATEGTIAFPATSGFVSRNNVFYTPSGPSRAVNWGGQSNTVAAWCNASTRDCNSKGADPLFVNTSSVANINLRLGAGSPAIGAGENGTDAGAYPFGPDAAPPAAIGNLSVLMVSDRVVTLTWTAPGDNGNNGTASVYDIRYSTSAITAANFNSAAAFTPVPLPLAAGTSQSFIALDLTPGTTYWFAIKARDAANNWSTVSNVVSAQTAAADRTPPAAVQDLQTGP